MRIIGRKQEQDELARLLSSKRPEFVVVYGRRRVGKTFLIREYFNNEFAFYATGVANGDMQVQLRSFWGSLREHGVSDAERPSNWFDAFDQLKGLLQQPDARRDAVSGKLVVFIDELPWLDTPRANFKQALDLFWNGWASARPDILLIVCGSATSWVANNLLQDHGGFHNRITARLHLGPFTLSECEEYFVSEGFAVNRMQVVESYMAFGGVPYYLDLMDRRLSVTQNIERLCFSKRGALRHEYNELVRSLFKNSEWHLKVIEAVSMRRGGLLRAEIEAKTGSSGGGSLTRTLEELEQCGFIRRYRDFTRNKREFYYQLVDPFMLFHHRFIASLGTDAEGTWVEFTGSAGYRAWCGQAFELVCLLHIEQIKQALGIGGIASDVCSWRSKDSSPGAQIDLIINRADGVASICEMKYSMGEFAIDRAYDLSLRNKLDAFASETKTSKALQLVLVTMNGVKRNKHWGIVQREITAEDLFAF